MTPDDAYFKVGMNNVANVLNELEKKRKKQGWYGGWIISKRLKSTESRNKKIERKRRERQEYQVVDLKDIAGVRVIVEHCGIASGLANYLVQHEVFQVLEEEEFINNARSDGYRGLHLVLDVPVRLDSECNIPVELQIRSILQHHWAELSHCEIYKSVDEIPPLLLDRMRTLSDMLYCADRDSENLLRARIHDECEGALRNVLRGTVLEKLGRQELHKADATNWARLGIGVVEATKQMRRAIMTEGSRRDSAMEAFKSIKNEIADDIAIKEVLERVENRLKRFFSVMPEGW